MSELREAIAAVVVDPDDGACALPLEYILIRGFSAMGWALPAQAAGDMLDAIAAAAAKNTNGLSYQLVQVRRDTVEECAAIAERCGADHDSEIMRANGTAFGQRIAASLRTLLTDD